MEKKYLTIEQEMMLKPITEDLSIICYAPNLYPDRLQPNFCKNIPSSIQKILIRFYGVKKGESLIGYVKYSLSITENLGIIDTIWIEPKLQRSGLGSLLLNVFSRYNARFFLHRNNASMFYKRCNSFLYSK